MDRPRTAPHTYRRVIAGLIVACGLLGLATVRNELGTVHGDSPRYIFLAESLINGRGHVESPLLGGHPEVMFPPLFPLMLSPIVGLWGVRAYMPMHLLIVLCATACLCLWAAWWRTEHHPTGDAEDAATHDDVGSAAGHRVAQADDEPLVWSLAIFGTCPLFVVFEGRILSEIPFMMWSLAAIIMATRYQRLRRLASPEAWWMLLCLLAAYYTRTAGVVLLAVVTVWMTASTWPRSRRLALQRAVLLGGTLGGGVLLWHLRNLLVLRHEGRMLTYKELLRMNDPYRPELGPMSLPDLWSRWLENVQAYAGIIGAELAYPIRYLSDDRWMWACVGVVCALVLVGCVARFRRRPGLSEWYLLGYAALFSVWPFQEPRFIVPVLPWLVLYLVEGVRAMGRAAEHLASAGRADGAPRLQGRRLAACALAALLLLQLAAVGNLLYNNQRGVRFPAHIEDWLAANRWLTRYAPADAVILSLEPYLTAHLTGRRTISQPWSLNRARVIDLLDQQGVTHLLVENTSMANRYIKPALLEFPERFDPTVVRFGQTFIARMRRGESTGQPDRAATTNVAGVASVAPDETTAPVVSSVSNASAGTAASAKDY